MWHWGPSLQGDGGRKGSVTFLVGKKFFYITKHRRWPMRGSDDYKGALFEPLFTFSFDRQGL